MKSTIRKATKYGMKYRRWDKTKRGQFKPLPSYAEKLAEAIRKEEEEAKSEKP